MSTNYPTSLDSYTNPLSTDKLNSPSHADQHGNVNDAVEAIETRLGTGADTAPGAASKVFRSTSATASEWGKVALGTDTSGSLSIAAVSSLSTVPIPESKLSFSNGIWRMSATAWTKIINLSGVGTIGDTDVDVTANTSATATAILVYGRAISGNITNATFIDFRKKGDTYGDGYVSRLYCPPANNYYNSGFFVIPLDANQVFTYQTNANVGSSTFEVWIVGYMETT